MRIIELNSILSKEKKPKRSELPRNWKLINIEELVEKDKHALKAGPFGSALKKEYYVKAGYKIYGQEQVISGDPNFGDYYISEDKYNELKSNRVKPNDILISLVGTVGKALILPEGCREGIINPRLIKITLDTTVYLPKFFKYYFESASVKSFYSSKAQGTTMDVLNLGIIKKIPFPLCSVHEQQLVIDKIEELFSELDKSIEDLKTAQQQLKVYRQSVLKWAFEGKLTNENVKAGELPEGWELKEIKAVCTNIKVGIVIKPTRFYSTSENGIKVFRSANVREFRINDSDWVYFSEDGNEINYRTKLKEGDVLLVRSGYPGTSCVVSKKFEGSNAIDILIATPNKDLITSEYLCCFNNSPLGKGLFKSKSRGVAQKHLNVGEYSKLKINVPSISKQKQIVQDIENRLSVADKLEETIASSLQQAEALKQSILKKAFEGRLV